MQPGLSERDSRIAFDVGTHAAGEALELLMNVCDTCETGQQKIASSVTAFALLKYRIKAISEAMNKIIPNFIQSVDEAAAVFEADDSDRFHEFADARRKERGL